MKKVYGSSESNSAPLSQAHEVNGFIFVSGQVHADKDLNLQGVTIEEKFLITMKNVENILEKADLTKKDIVQLRIFLTDLSELPKLNEVYKQYFEHPFPARTAIGVTKLPLNADLEIEVIASR